MSYGSKLGIRVMAAAALMTEMGVITSHPISDAELEADAYMQGFDVSLSPAARSIVERRMTREVPQFRPRPGSQDDMSSYLKPRPPKKKSNRARKQALNRQQRRERKGQS